MLLQHPIVRKLLLLDDGIDLPRNELILRRLTHLALATTLIYIPFYFIAGNYIFGTIQFVTALLVGAIFFFIKHKHYIASGYMLVGFLTTTITLGAVVTPDVGTELLLIPIAAVLNTIFEKRIHAVICFITLISLYTYIEVNNDYWTPYFTYEDSFHKALYLHNVSTVFFVSFLIVLHFDLNMKSYVKELKHINSELGFKNLQIEEQTEEILQQQKMQHDLELEFKKKDIELLNANNIMKLQLQNKLIKDLNQISKSKDLKKDLNSLINELKRQVKSQEKIELLQGKIESVNSQFSDRLEQLCPNLSKTEREICSYIKLNLSNKEISEIRNTTPNSIRVTKHRIRKKMEIEDELELDQYIQGL
ncbi:helix-turn-helix transcriptional regulator [Flammeovirga agarivorans]|uniref:HTH luxR-type domain-containing protein n=1 Tax=Flammeovirga agarivorans TaxID=2726742 RepID=A0A7X8SL49_9BACT|nr:LuxR C-terminal-related transcriptional regulator [Flammeovirga agarivorans]NLR92127.1 hypothetical protein [Flammeovirga agarivorans]